MNRRLRPVLAVLVVALLLAVVPGAPSAGAQEDGPEERNPVEGIVGVPLGEVCALQGTLVLVETVARGGLPPELLRTLLETLAVPLSTACTLVPPRDRLTRCTGDHEINDISQGLVGAAPVGDVVQILEEVESALGVDGAATQALIDALACEQFEFGQGDGGSDGEVFVPPTRPAPPADGGETVDPTGSGVVPVAGRPSTGGAGVPGLAPSARPGAGTGATTTTPPRTADTDGDGDEVAAPVVEPAASIADQIDLFAVVVCLGLFLATAAALLPDGWLLGALRRRGSDR